MAEETHSHILVLGAVRSGKSRYAQQLADGMWKRPLFLATAEVVDDEMAERVAAHKRARDARWACMEEPLEIARVISKNPSNADGILIDCVTIWLSNVLLKENAGAFERRKDDFIEALRAARQDVILVSNEVGMGIVPDNDLARAFRDLAGQLNQALAAEVSTVVLMVAGLPLSIKGQLPESPVISGVA